MFLKRQANDTPTNICERHDPFSELDALCLGALNRTLRRTWKIIGRELDHPPLFGWCWRRVSARDLVSLPETFVVSRMWISFAVAILGWMHLDQVLSSCKSGSSNLQPLSALRTGLFLSANDADPLV